MNSLVAKIMSKEDLPDSDARKTYSLYPIPPHCLISFRRGEEAPELLLESKEDNLPSTIIPLTDCGNVYILGDGKTISTFCPDPYPITPRRIAGENAETRIEGPGFTVRSEGEIQLTSPKLSIASSQSIKVTHPNVYNDVLTLLNTVALPSTYSVANPWNMEIAKAMADQFDAIIAPRRSMVIKLTTPAEAESTSAISNYRRRVNDALINYKNAYLVTLLDQREGGYELHIAPAEAIDALVVTQTDKTTLDNRGLTGMINNQMLRAFKLLSFGARTVVLSPPLIIGAEESAAIKEVFKERNKMSVTFTQQNNVVILMKFNNIIEA